MSQFDPYMPPKFVPPNPEGKLPYGPPPPVLTWYRVYCVAMVVLNVLVSVAAAALLLFLNDIAPDLSQEDRLGLQIQAGVYAVFALPMAVVHGVGVAVPRKRWGWVYGIVVVGLGLTSCCTWPATIPLLIFWLKPETKAYFGA